MGALIVVMRAFAWSRSEHAVPTLKEVPHHASSRRGIPHSRSAGRRFAMSASSSSCVSSARQPAGPRRSTPRTSAVVVSRLSNAREGGLPGADNGQTQLEHGSTTKT
jgi:hypothetical protein